MWTFSRIQADTFKLEESVFKQGVKGGDKTSLPSGCICTDCFFQAAIKNASTSDATCHCWREVFLRKRR